MRFKVVGVDVLPGRGPRRTRNGHSVYYCEAFTVSADLIEKACKMAGFSPGSNIIHIGGGKWRVPGVEGVRSTPLGSIYIRGGHQFHLKRRWEKE